MFKRILVPLDGSARAESAIPLAARLARASGGSIFLAQVATIPVMYESYSGASIVGEMLDTEVQNAEDYLQGVKAFENLAGIPVEASVLVGAPAQTLLAMATIFRADLIVMTSQGRTGVKRWLPGSVAQSLSRTCRVPLLVLHEEGSAPDSAFPDPLRPLRSIVAEVALDGSQFAEAAILPTATLVAALAAPVQGTVVLTRVVPLSALGGTTGASEPALDEAESYLRQARQRYAEVAEQYNLSLQTAIATGKEAADALIRSAEQGDTLDGHWLAGGCDLIALTTHGRGGLQRLALGSVTERVLGATRLPLLVVHAPA